MARAESVSLPACGNLFFSFVRIRVLFFCTIEKYSSKNAMFIASLREIQEAGATDAVEKLLAIVQVQTASCATGKNERFASKRLCREMSLSSMRET